MGTAASGDLPYRKVDRRDFLRVGAAWSTVRVEQGDLHTGRRVRALPRVPPAGSPAPAR